MYVVSVVSIDIVQVVKIIKMVETPRTQVAVLEGQYACLVDQGVPFSGCLRLQQLGLQLNQAQWTARNSLGGFSIAFSGKESKVKKKSEN